ncbi:uncharacterized protein [Diabrotica undecimpunctata]|uniref:uncharacterized protein n=1 Tax=Diabrotica undecimpunctata TaxID=50387 RepID=UPI003B641E4F
MNNLSSGCFFVRANLYADDLVVYIKCKNITSGAKILQNLLYKIEEWSSKTGFLFSTNKTHYTVFSKRKNTIPVSLIFNGQNISHSEESNFLDLKFDYKLNWKTHITNLQPTCQNRINLLKILSSNIWGADSSILLNLYKSIIRSKLDYGAICYDTANKTFLKNLNTIQTALRLAVIVFRTSPVSSLQVISREPPLHLRRHLLSLNYAARISSNKKHPLYSEIINVPTSNLYRKKQYKDKPFRERINQKGFNCNEFKLSITTKLDFPKWLTPLPITDLTLTQYPKNTTNPNLIINAFKEIMEKYPNHHIIYTDASKTENVHSAAFTNKNYKYAIRIPQHCRIYTGETTAILEAIKNSSSTTENNILIITDSLSAIHGINQLFPSHPIAQNIRNELNALHHINKKVTFIWIPSHIGIQSNEEVDQLALKSIGNENVPEITKYPHTDHKQQSMNHIINLWQATWDATDSKLKTIKPRVDVSLPQQGKRRDHVIVNRLRIGHTILTHHTF